MQTRMKVRTKVWGVIAAVVVVLGGAGLVWGPGLYARWAGGNTQAAPALDADAPIGDVATLDGTWTAQPGSYAGYRVDEVLRGTHVTVTGRTETVEAEVTIDGGAVTAATVTVDVASVGTDQGARDSYFRSTALSTDEFPTATFVLTEPATLPDGTSAVELTGDLTIKGVTMPVTVDAEAGQPADDAVQVVGSIPLTFADYGVTAPSLGFVEVEDTGFVEFSLLLAQAG